MAFGGSFAKAAYGVIVGLVEGSWNAVIEVPSHRFLGPCLAFFGILLQKAGEIRKIGTALDAGASVQNPEFVNAAIADPLATATMQHGNDMVRAFWKQT